MSESTRTALIPDAGRRAVVFVGGKGSVASRVQQALKRRRSLSLSCHATPSDAEAAAKPAQAPALYVVCFDFPTARRRSAALQKSLAAPLLRFVRTVSARHPNVPVVVTTDEASEHLLIERALRLGASDVISPFDAKITSLIDARLDTALTRAESDQTAGKTDDAEVATADLEPDPGRVSPVEAAQAVARVRARARSLPTRTERRQPLAAVLDITTPELRATSGRLDARRVAERLDVSLRSVARATGVSHQALSATPDSKRAQVGLDAIARALGTLDALLPEARARAWLHTPHARLKGDTPLQALLDGRAERVATMLSVAREGGVA